MDKSLHAGVKARPLSQHCITVGNGTRVAWLLSGPIPHVKHRIRHERPPNCWATAVLHQARVRMKQQFVSSVLKHAVTVVERKKVMQHSGKHAPLPCCRRHLYLDMNISVCTINIFSLNSFQLNIGKRWFTGRQPASLLFLEMRPVAKWGWRVWQQCLCFISPQSSLFLFSLPALPPNLGTETQHAHVPTDWQVWKTRDAGCLPVAVVWKPSSFTFCDLCCKLCRFFFFFEALFLNLWRGENLVIEFVQAALCTL